MRCSEIRTMATVLRQETGGKWPVFGLSCLVRSRRLYSQTRWKASHGDEAAFARRLSLNAAMYLGLGELSDRDRAFESMRRILVPIGCREQWRNLDSLECSHKEAMERLLEFYEFMGRGGVGRFVQRRVIEQTGDVLSYEVRGCFFCRFYEEAGTPELARLFCEVDREFFPRAFPEFTFHRSNSWENTTAFGAEHCKFVFERTTSPQERELVRGRPRKAPRHAHTAAQQD